jgi:tartrate dehydrogenase/decarboxylase/D-malate dehydrogenase
MMLDHLGHPEAATVVLSAIEAVLSRGPRTRDIGGEATTEQMGRAIKEAV